MKDSKSYPCGLIIFLLMSSSVGAASSPSSTASAREVTMRECVLCHSFDYIEMNAPVMTAARWESTIRKMVDSMGARVNEQDFETILDYLTTNFTN